MISIDAAREIIRSLVDVRQAVETPLADAPGGVLADPARAGGHFPTGDRATMDGYVIGGEAAPGEFRVTGEIPAGKAPPRILGSGEAFRIFTGALLPEGGGRVLMQEDVRREGDLITIDQFSENRFIRRHGSEAAPDDIVLPAGTRLGAAELAILAQIGMVRPRLVRRPVVRHLATGDELVSPAEIPGPGQIRDTNTTLLAGLLTGLGITLGDTRRVADDPAGIHRVAEGDWDLLLISGGASVGDYDFGAESLRQLGFTIHFGKVNLRPGKPLTFATRGTQAAFVIPGNPVSHFVTFQIAIRLAVEILAGLPVNWNFLNLEIHGGEPITANQRETFWPARVFVKEGALAVSPKRWSTSGDTFSLAGTNALIRVNATSPAGGKARTLLLDLPAGGP